MEETVHMEGEARSKMGPPVTCEQLHQNGCTEELKSGWSFCTHCGSRIVAFDWKERTVSLYPGSSQVELVLMSDILDTKLTIQLTSRSDRIMCVNPSIDLRGRAGETRKVDLQISESLVSGEIEAKLLDVRREPDQPPFSQEVGVRSAAKVARESITKSISILKRDQRETRIESSASLICASSGWSHFDISLIDGQLEEVEFERLPDWDIDFPQGTKIRSTSSLQVKIKPRAHAKARTIEFRGVGSGSSFTIDLEPPMGREMKVLPRFIVGIDFGTSSTSISYVDLNAKIPGSDQRQEIQFVGESSRFPSCVHIENPVNQSTWWYGKKAIEKAEMASGEFISEFKKYLWRPGETQVAPNLSAERVFQWFIEQLYRDHIQPRLEAIEGVDISGINFILRFSMPVLNDAEVELYRTRIESACAHAGIRQMGNIEFHFEPDSAMKGVLDAERKALQAFNTGDVVMVVDSGAGTTDVCLGSIEVADGRWYLAVSSFEAIAFSSLREKGLCVGEQFGGGDVTRLMGSDAIERWAYLASEPKDEEKEKRYRDCINAIGKTLKVNRKGDMFHWPSLKSEFSPFDSGIGREKYWDVAAPRLFETMEKMKIEGLTKSLDTYDVMVVKGVAGEHEQLRLTSKSITSAVDTFRAELDKSLQEVLDRSDPKPKWIIYVGGNMNIPQFQWKEPKGHVRSVTVSNDSLRLAVVKGLVGNHEQSKKLRYDVRVILKSNSFEAELIYLQANRVAGSASKSTKVQVPTESLAVQIEALTQDGWKLLNRKAIPQGYTEATFKILYSKGQVRSILEVPGAIVDLFTMEIP